MNLVEAALGYAELGWPVFPCIPDAKEPLTKNGFKNASTMPGQIKYWWRRWPNANPAVATGAPGPDVVDIDTKHGRDGLDLYRRAWREGHFRTPVAVIRTPSGGLHLWFNGTDQRGQAVGKSKSLELKAVGGYVLLPPAHIVVPGEGGYSGHYEMIERRDIEATVDFDAVRDLLNPRPAYTPPARKRAWNPDEVRVGDDFNQRVDWHDILTRHGWTYLGQKGRTRLWRRPGKDRGISATTNALGTDRLHVFTSSTVFEQNESYSKFGAIAILEFGGQFAAATRALGRLGFGKRSNDTRAAA